MKFTFSAILLAAALVISGCGKTGDDPNQPTRHSGSETIDQAHTPALAHTPPHPVAVAKHTGVVEEVLQASSYTYLNIKEGDRTYWIAVTKRDMKPGDSITFAEGLAMTNFPSKDLNRTFETVYFVSEVFGGPPAGEGMPPTGGAHQITTPEQPEIKVDPAPGGITIGELFANRDTHSGKTVVIRGQVTKVNRAIMGKNWVHLQDGTSADGQFDLTATTLEEANVGEVVTFEGTITLNKDFGAGYQYDVIMEDAKRTTE